MKRIAFLSGLIVFLSACSSIDQPTENGSELHHSLLTLDSHADTPLNLVFTNIDLSIKNVAPASRVDLPRMQEGGLDAVFFAIFTGQRDRTEENYQQVYEKAHLTIDSVNSFLRRNQDQAQLALSVSDAASISAQGKKAIYMGMENGFPIAKDITRIEEFYNEGVRYITLSHSSNNDICDSSTDTNCEEHGGLSAFGKEVVAEMNRLGIMVDVSHISDKAFYDVLETSVAPVIASHSSLRAICNHPRNISNEMIQALAANGGVIQVCLLGAYIRKEDPNSLNYIKKQELETKYDGFNFENETQQKAAWEEWDAINKNFPADLPTISDAVDHIDHAVNLVGVDHVGIGSDFDGGGGLADCVDVSDFPKITEELVRRGYSKEEIGKIWGGNFLRVFKEVELIAESQGR